jgi:hypothetical protein
MSGSGEYREVDTILGLCQVENAARYARRMKNDRGKNQPFGKVRKIASR